MGRFRVTLSEKFENELVAHAIDLQQRFYGIHLRRLPFQLAEMEKLNHQFHMEKQIAFRKCFNEFLHRHPELSVHEAEATSMSRAVAYSKPQMKRFLSC